MITLPIVRLSVTGGSLRWTLSPNLQCQHCLTRAVYTHAHVINMSYRNKRNTCNYIDFNTIYKKSVINYLLLINVLIILLLNNMNIKHSNNENK